MKTCEEYEMNLSAMIDGELHGDELTETIKHLGECPECMKTLGIYQAMQEEINRHYQPDAVPDNLWGKINPGKDTAKPKSEHHGGKTVIPMPPWLTGIISAAAAIILILISSFILRDTYIFPLQESKIPLLTSTGSSGMTEERFVNFTRELLSADPVYHRKMYLILSALYNEGSMTELQDPSESDQGLQPEFQPGRVDSTGRAWY
ncbi:zf-HC2 domain-containing protein [bacterium]|nr:zf-HC2 domain-containing protein [bacterium]